MAETICRKFLEAMDRGESRTAFLTSVNGTWVEISWAQYGSVVATLAAGLSSLGVGAGDRVVIFANTRVEWAYADMAILGLGAITVPIYQSSTSADVEYILNNSEAKAVIVENFALWSKVKNFSKEISTLKTVIYMDDPPTSEDLDLDRLAKKGSDFLATSPNFFKESLCNVSSSDVATILYTSGTTGQPKGVVLTHTQVMSEVTDTFPLLGVTARDRTLTFLPFAHILGRIEVWGHVLIGYTMALAESIERIKDNLAIVQPTIIVAVPRIFEKIYNGVLAQAEISPMKNRVFHWAIAIGKQASKYKIEHKPIPIDLALQYRLAKILVFDKLAAKLGGHLRFAMVGGAPMSQAIAEFFHAAGLLLLEGYGLTETTGAVTVNTTFDYRFGSVGKAIGDVEIKLAKDGEILVKSKKVMKEYYLNPEATTQAIEDGWFHTGDIGEISDDGFIKVTDRKKDLIKTAGGKYVAPQKLEGLLKANRFISQVHIHGDRKKYVVALVTLNKDAVAQYAKEHEISYQSNEALFQNPKIQDLVRSGIADANTQLAPFESIKTFAIIPKEFTIESGELTPSLKVKRKVVDTHYKDVIDKLYPAEA